MWSSWREEDASGEGLGPGKTFENRQCGLSRMAERKGPVDGIREGTGAVQVQP